MGNDLGESSFGALPGVARPGRCQYRAIGLHPYGATISGRDGGPAFAVGGRSVVGVFNKHCQPQAQVTAFDPGLPLDATQSLVVHVMEPGVQTGPVRQPLHSHPAGQRVRLMGIGPEVQLPEIDWIHAYLARHQIHADLGKQAG